MDKIETLKDIDSTLFRWLKAQPSGVRSLCREELVVVSRLGRRAPLGFWERMGCERGNSGGGCSP